MRYVQCTTLPQGVTKYRNSNLAFGLEFFSEFYNTKMGLWMARVRFPDGEDSEGL